MFTLFLCICKSNINHIKVAPDTNLGNLIMEKINISYQDICNRNGSETLFQWYKGRDVTFSNKDGVLHSWSCASIYDNEQKHFIIPVGLVQENGTNKIIVVPANRITIK